ncbi:PTS glucose transporter subunit IIA [Geomicrobium sp. JCM 19039]|uniref:PTS sugar transporter subunit IIA n=1 Tax=Geomicrobium sp. JCM 19039 TaxID=1460636 RepID=UPI00045F4DA1|nr:PTS glucose transporter subunit IIA [Geomicrobium sp. JCM 19039]GAK13159.1 PTS system, glucose-specific IIA component [Geomicrobium sp. JCM 19039]
MLKKLFGKQRREEKIYAPIQGKTVSLDDVPDPTFSKRMMGEGIAIMPENGQVVSPVNGKIEQVFPTKHAIGITSETGLGILIHIGLETVQLDGQGFESHVVAGQKVNVGDSLITFNVEHVKVNAESLITPIIITEGADHEVLTITEENVDVRAGEDMIVHYQGS